MTIDKGNDNWKVMNDLDNAFSYIRYLDFLVDELQRAVDKEYGTSLIDITEAITAYLPVFTAQYDRAQSIAWSAVVPQDKKTCEGFLIEEEPDVDWPEPEV